MSSKHQPLAIENHGPLLSACRTRDKRRKSFEYIALGIKVAAGIVAVVLAVFLAFVVLVIISAWMHHLVESFVPFLQPLYGHQVQNYLGRACNTNIHPSSVRGKPNFLPLQTVQPKITNEYSILPIRAVPSPSDTTSSTRATTTGTPDSCVRDFCNWTAGVLTRCYHLDTNTKNYTNQSWDDFKWNAPLECNLCIPETDHYNIEQYCTEVAGHEVDVLYGVIGILGGFVALALLCLLGKHLYNRRRHRKSQQTKKQNEKNEMWLDGACELGSLRVRKKRDRKDRVPILPRAHSSAVYENTLPIPVHVSSW